MDAPQVRPWPRRQSYAGAALRLYLTEPASLSSHAGKRAQQCVFEAVPQYRSPNFGRGVRDQNSGCAVMKFSPISALTGIVSMSAKRCPDGMATSQSSRQSSSHQMPVSCTGGSKSPALMSPRRSACASIALGISNRSNATFGHPSIGGDDRREGRRSRFDAGDFAALEGSAAGRGRRRVRALGCNVVRGHVDFGPFQAFSSADQGRTARSAP